MKDVYYFQTVNGSIYRIDQVNMEWSREKVADTSGRIRSEGGHLVVKPSISVGFGAILQDDNVRPGHTIHYVYTSDVKRIW